MWLPIKIKCVYSVLYDPAKEKLFIVTTYSSQLCERIHIRVFGCVNTQISRFFTSVYNPNLSQVFEKCSNERDEYFWDREKTSDRLYLCPSCFTFPRLYPLWQRLRLTQHNDNHIILQPFATIVLPTIVCLYSDDINI